MRRLIRSCYISVLLLWLLPGCQTTANKSSGAKAVDAGGGGTPENFQHMTSTLLQGMTDKRVRFVHDDQNEKVPACLNRVFRSDGTLDAVKFDKNACTKESSIWYIYLATGGVPIISAEKQSGEIDILKSTNILVTYGNIVSLKDYDVNIIKNPSSSTPDILTLGLDNVSNKIYLGRNYYSRENPIDKCLRDSDSRIIRGKWSAGEADFIGFEGEACAWVDRVVGDNNETVFPQISQRGVAQTTPPPTSILTKQDCRLAYLGDFKVMVAVGDDYNTAAQFCAKADNGIGNGFTSKVEKVCKVKNLSNAEYRAYFGYTDPIWVRDETCDGQSSLAYRICYRSLRYPDITVYHNNKSQLYPVPYVDPNSGGGPSPADSGYYMPSLSDLKSSRVDSPDVYFSDYVWLVYARVGSQEQYLIRPAIYRDGCNPYRYGTTPFNYCISGENVQEDEFAVCKKLLHPAATNGLTPQ